MSRHGCLARFQWDYVDRGDGGAVGIGQIIVLGPTAEPGQDHAFQHRGTGPFEPFIIARCALSRNGGPGVGVARNAPQHGSGGVERGLTQHDPDEGQVGLGECIQQGCVATTRMPTQKPFWGQAQDAKLICAFEHRELIRCGLPDMAAPGAVENILDFDVQPRCGLAILAIAHDTRALR